MIFNRVSLTRGFISASTEALPLVFTSSSNADFSISVAVNFFDDFFLLLDQIRFGRSVFRLDFLDT